MTGAIVRKLCFVLCVALFGAFFGAVFNHGLNFSLDLQNQMHWLTLLLPFVLFVTLWSEERVYRMESQDGSSPRAVEREVNVVMGFLTVPLTWMSHLGGASVGREGVAVQLGRSVSAVIRRFSFFENLQASELFVIRCGAAAGFAAVFGSPCAAAVFSFEAFSQKFYSVDVVDSSNSGSFIDFLFVAACSFAANASAGMFFGVSHAHLSAERVEFSAELLFFLFLLALVFLIVSNIHVRIGRFLNQQRELLMPKYSFVLVVLSVIFCVFLFVPQARIYRNLGTNFIDHFFKSGSNEFQFGLWDWLVKLVATLFSVSLGFKGGEVTPLLSVGVLLSFSLSSVVPLTGSAIAVAGYTGMFAAVFRVPLTGAVLAFESFGINGWSGAVVCCFLLLMKNFRSVIWKR